MVNVFNVSALLARELRMANASEYIIGMASQAIF